MFNRGSGNINTFQNILAFRKGKQQYICYFIDVLEFVNPSERQHIQILSETRFKWKILLTGFVLITMALK